MRPLNRFSLMAACLVSLSTQASDLTPVGRWKTFDDETGKPKAVVVIEREGGTLSGRVAEVLEEPPDGEPLRCTACEGERRDAPILGMRIIWDMQREGDAWTGGRVLDPETGNIYKATMSLRENGQKLEVRGYIGFSLFGRSQVWQRLD